VKEKREDENNNEMGGGKLREKDIGRRKLKICKREVINRWGRKKDGELKELRRKENMKITYT
jgi:hypothetical protein